MGLARLTQILLILVALTSTQASVSFTAMGSEEVKPRSTHEENADSSFIYEEEEEELETDYA